MKEAIIKACTTGRCMWFIVIVTFLVFIPVPARWNVVLDSQGSNVEDYIFYIGLYLILAACFLTISITTGNLIAKILFWLALGKLIDQFYNPYGYHISELIWDVIIIGWTLYRKIICRKKTKNS